MKSSEINSLNVCSRIAHRMDYANGSTQTMEYSHYLPQAASYRPQLRVRVIYAC